MATLRLQVRHWRALLWAGAAGCGVLAAFQGYRIWDHHRSGDYEPLRAEHFSGLIGNAHGDLAEEDVRVADWRDYEKLKSCPINGYVKQVALPPPPKVDTPVVISEKPLTEVLIVTAVTCAPGEAARVMVKYKDDTIKPTKDELLLKVGATLTTPYDDAPYNCVLKAVNPGSAVFSWFGKEVEIHPIRRAEVAKATSSATDAPTAKVIDTNLTDAEKQAIEAHKKSKNPKATSSFSGDGYVIGSGDIEEMNADVNKFLGEATISERKDANGNSEVFLGMVKPRGRLGKDYGVQTGDTVVSINSVPVSSKAGAIRWAQEHADLPKYVVVLRRKGKEITKTYLVPQD